MALVRPVLLPLSCSKETFRNAPKHEFWVQLSGSGAFVAKNSDATLFSVICALMAPVRPVLHRLSGSKETVRTAPKYEFWVQWTGSGAFVAKKN
jgi:hypothetical protein